MNKRLANADIFDIKLGSVLRKARKEKKMSMEMVGEKMGCTKQMISLFEIGASALSAKQLKQLCEIYGIDFGETLRKADE